MSAGALLRERCFTLVPACPARSAARRVPISSVLLLLSLFVLGGLSLLWPAQVRAEGGGPAAAQGGAGAAAPDPAAQPPGPPPPLKGKEAKAFLDQMLGPDRPSSAKIMKMIQPLVKGLQRDLLAEMKKADPSTKSIADYFARHADGGAYRGEKALMKAILAENKDVNHWEHKFVRHSWSYRQNISLGVDKTLPGGAYYDFEIRGARFASNTKKNELAVIEQHEWTHGVHAEKFIAKHGPLNDSNVILAMVEGPATYAMLWRLKQPGALTQQQRISGMGAVLQNLMGGYMETAYRSGKMSQTQIAKTLQTSLGMPQERAQEMAGQLAVIAKSQPGFVSCYAYGTARILQMKDKLQKKLGAKFDEKGFHNHFFDASVVTKEPVTYAQVEKSLDKYARNRLAHLPEKLTERQLASKSVRKEVASNVKHPSSSAKHQSSGMPSNLASMGTSGKPTHTASSKSSTGGTAPSAHLSDHHSSRRPNVTSVASHSSSVHMTSGRNASTPRSARR